MESKKGDEQKEKQGGPSMKKAKRCTWDETIENDKDVLEKDRNGHYVLCKFCKKSGSKDPLFIKSQDPFGTKAWIKHKASKTHLSLVEKSSHRLLRFLKDVWVQINLWKTMSRDLQCA
jgi:hypothetical protein